MKQGIMILSVKDVNRIVKDLVEKNPSAKDIYIRGEISNFTNHSSGHMYFSLKDPHGVLKIVMFKQNNLGLKFLPQNGMKVILRGDITVYEKSGVYQIQAKEMIPDGVGSLHLAFEQLKERLHEEGLFDPSLKKEIPLLPKTIGVITSPTGAAVRDIFITIRRRYPLAKIIFLPVLVQGDQAAQSVSNAIETMDAYGKVDVLIVGRGGGSIEDLWAFNEEVVARAIAGCTIPVISAVGHETDVTISDFVADVRAATPTAAAEIATSYTMEELARLVERYELDLMTSLEVRIERNKLKLSTLEKTLSYFHPERQVKELMQTVDALQSQLITTMQYSLRNKQNEAAILSQKLASFKPQEKIQQAKTNLLYKQEALAKQMMLLVEKKREQYSLNVAKLDQLSPLKTLSRGYAIVQKEDHVVKSTKEVSSGDTVKVRLAEGTLICEVKETEETK